MMNAIAEPLVGWMRPIYGFFSSPDPAAVHVQAGSFPELLVAAARNLFGEIVANLDDVRPMFTEQIQISGANREEILLDWLKELLVLFETQTLVFSQFEVYETEDGVRAVALGEQLDLNRHVMEREICGIDSNSLILQQCEKRWQADVRLET